MAHPHRDALLRPWWNFIHHWTGRLIVVLSISNVFVGMKLIEPHIVVWKYVYSVLLALLALTAVVLEAQLIWRWVLDENPTTSLQVGWTARETYYHLAS